MIELEKELCDIYQTKELLENTLNEMIFDAEKDIEKLRLSLMVEYSDENFDHMILLMNKIKEIKNENT